VPHWVKQPLRPFFFDFLELAAPCRKRLRGKPGLSAGRVCTIRFIQLYVLVIVRLDRRELVWINVTAHPTAEWIA